MNMAILHFSARSSGNCQCFTRAEACPHAQDDVRRIYQAIMDADLAYFILPNYADQPPALYYASTSAAIASSRATRRC